MTLKERAKKTIRQLKRMRAVYAESGNVPAVNKIDVLLKGMEAR